MKNKTVVVGIIALLFGILASFLLSRYFATDKTETIVVLLPTSTNKYWQAVSDGAKRAALEIEGAYKVEIRTGDEDADAVGQMALLRGFLERAETAALVIGPASSSQPVPLVAEYIRADIPVVVIDSLLDQTALDLQGVNVSATIVSDNQHGGELAAQEFADRLGPGPHSVVMLEGDPVHESARQRKSGFEKAIQADWDVRYLRGDWRVDIARSAVADFLIADRFEALFSASDEMAIGAIAAIKRAGIDNAEWPLIIGFDASIDGLNALQNGEMLATVKQDAEGLGYKGVTLAAQILDGEIKPNPTLNILLPVELVFR